MRPASCLLNKTRPVFSSPSRKRAGPLQLTLSEFDHIPRIMRVPNAYH